MFDDVLGEFARRPGVDGAVDRGRWRPGAVDDWDDLFGRTAARGAGTRRSGQNRRDQRAQITRVGLASGKLGVGRGPAPAPRTHRGAATIERLGQRVIALPGSGPQHDPYPERQCLWAGGLPQQGMQEELLWV